MDDRKQEAIGIIAEDLGAACLEGRLMVPATVYAASSRSEALYNRIAPLILGEFPDEELKKLLLDSTSLTPEALFWKIKCLIEGQPATKEEAT